MIVSGDLNGSQDNSREELRALSARSPIQTGCDYLGNKGLDLEYCIGYHLGSSCSKRSKKLVSGTDMTNDQMNLSLCAEKDALLHMYTGT
ncbi:hypothetical protein BGX20_008606, partial [Mortierella sp. AD010]